jgi:hypothetical protein
MKSEEARLQAACMTWVRLQYPNLNVWHCPNGGSRNAIEAANLKRQGVKAGVCDIHVDKAAGGFHGLKIEMKVGKNRLTPAQEAYFEQCERDGYKTAVCRTFEEFQATISHYFKKKNDTI